MDVLRVANCSGFFGDRLSAAREQVDGGPIDVLTGDWLAELTMLILARQRMKRPEAGWARTFLTQLEDVLGDCLDRGIKVVSNAGGLNPRGCAEAVVMLADRLGLRCTVACVEGDDLMPRVGELDLRNLDTGEILGTQPITANAYIGGWGIARALKEGADVVVTGRCTDAAVVAGPAAWRFGWTPDDLDALAGAVVAGHVIECGPQATGGNYSFFKDIPGLEHPGFPIAEISPDGSAVITKHPGTGGAVTIGTVTAQLLYEIAEPAYANPDVTARFDTIRLEQDGPDRVRIHGVRGEPPPDTLKAAVNVLGGYRNTMTFVLTGLDIEEKAALAERTLLAMLPDGIEEIDVRLSRTDRSDPGSNEEALATLKVTVKDPDEKRVGRAFSNPVIEMALASYPGFFTTSAPGEASPYGVYWPTAVPRNLVKQTVTIDGRTFDVDERPPAPARPADPPPPPAADPPDGDTRRAPLGLVAAARSGDKGGNANIGVWVSDDVAYAWLEGFLTTDRLRELVPETRDLRVDRYELPNIRALNFVVRGLLGRGVAASTRTDPQAKGLGEYLRAKHVDVPVALIGGGR